MTERLILCLSCKDKPHLQSAPMEEIVKQLTLDQLLEGIEPQRRVGYLEADGLLFATHTHRN